MRQIERNERGPVNSLAADIPAQSSEMSMSLLKEEPAGSVKSLEELFAIAAAMEQEAADTLRRDRRANAAGGRSGPGGGVRAPRPPTSGTPRQRLRVVASDQGAGTRPRMDSMGDVGDLRRRGRGDGAPAAAGGLSIALHGCTQRGARFRLLELCFRPCRGCGGPAGCRDHGSRGAWARVHPEAGAEECLPCRAQIVGFLHSGGMRSISPSSSDGSPTCSNPS